MEQDRSRAKAERQRDIVVTWAMGLALVASGVVLSTQLSFSRGGLRQIERISRSDGRSVAELATTVHYNLRLGSQTAIAAGLGLFGLYLALAREQRRTKALEKRCSELERQTGGRTGTE